MCLDLDYNLFNSQKSFLLIYSNTLSGITSASILLKTFERENLKFSAYCIEFISNEFINEINSDPFTNFNSNLILLGFKEEKSKEILAKFNFKTKFSLSNDKKAKLTSKLDTSNTALKAYFFAINKSSYNTDLLEIALVNYKDLNTLPTTLKEVAINEGVKFSETSTKTKAGIDLSFINKSLKDISAYGFNKGGVDIAIKGLLEGFDERYSGFAKKYKDEAKELILEKKDLVKIEVKKDYIYFNCSNLFSNFSLFGLSLVYDLFLENNLIKDKNLPLIFSKNTKTSPFLTSNLNTKNNSFLIFNLANIEHINWFKDLEINYRLNLLDEKSLIYTN